MGQERKPESEPAQPGLAHTLRLQGEVVQIHQERGQRVMKVAVRERSIVDLTVVTPTEIHLGDQVVVETRVEVGSVIRTAPSASPGDRALRHTGGTDE